MKITFAVLLLLASFNGFSYSNPQLTREKDASHSSRQGLKGNVKSLVTKKFYAIDKGGIVNKGKRFYTDDNDSIFFDINGNASKFYLFDFEGILVDCGLNSYDSMFYRSEQRIYDGKGNLVKNNTIKNKYDNNGNIIEITTISTYKANVSQTKVNFRYDERGNRIEMIFSGTGNKYVYKYNKDGKVIEESLISLTGKVICKEVYEYDIDGNRTLWDHFYSDGRLISRIKQKFNNNNPVYFETYEDEDGKLLLQSTSTRVYDLNNNIIEETSYSPNGDLIERETHKYKYDHQLNWIECIDYYNDKPTKIIERRIEYF